MSNRSRRSTPVATPTAAVAAPTTPSSRTTRASSPAPLSSRPQLPHAHANTLMAGYTGRMHKVKTQLLTLNSYKDEDKITIARIKTPVPKGVPGHIIKRFDTDAVSASSLFRAAFPTATEAEETTEMAWIAKGSRSRYGDTKKAGNEQDETKKLSGLWIPTAKAGELAAEYGITKFAADLIKFTIASDLVPGPQIDDSEIDSPAARSPRTKRQRVLSPPAGASTPTPKATVSISQTITKEAKTGRTKEVTQVEVVTPVANGLVASDAAIAAQIAEAKELVAATMASADASVSSTKKRALEDDDEEDEKLPTSGTLADVIDRRGFFGKLFKRAPRARKVPTNAGREIKAAGSQVAVMEERAVGGGRRWIAGFGLAMAVGATAAAPYLFG